MKIPPFKSSEYDCVVCRGHHKRHDGDVIVCVQAIDDPNGDRELNGKKVRFEGRGVCLSCLLSNEMDEIMASIKEDGKPFVPGEYERGVLVVHEGTLFGFEEKVLNFFNDSNNNIVGEIDAKITDLMKFIKDNFVNDKFFKDGNLDKTTIENTLKSIEDYKKTLISIKINEHIGIINDIITKENIFYTKKISGYIKFEGINTKLDEFNKKVVNLEFFEECVKCVDEISKLADDDNYNVSFVTNIASIDTKVNGEYDKKLDNEVLILSQNIINSIYNSIYICNLNTELENLKKLTFDASGTKDIEKLINYENYLKSYKDVLTKYNLNNISSFSTLKNYKYDSYINKIEAFENELTNKENETKYKNFVTKLTTISTNYNDLNAKYINTNIPDISKEFNDFEKNKKELESLLKLNIEYTHKQAIDLLEKFASYKTFLDETIENI